MSLLKYGHILLDKYLGMEYWQTDFQNVLDQFLLLSFGKLITHEQYKENFISVELWWNDQILQDNESHWR